MKPPIPSQYSVTGPAAPTFRRFRLLALTAGILGLLGVGPAPDKTPVPDTPPPPTATSTDSPPVTPTGTLTPPPSATPTGSPTATPVVVLPVYVEPTETNTPVVQVPTQDLNAEGAVPIPPELSVFPNPAQDKKVYFRFRSPEDWKFVVRIYDSYGDEAARLEQEGKDTFDLAWDLGKIESGIYYYRITAEHLASGRILRYPVGRFVVDRIGTRK